MIRLSLTAVAVLAASPALAVPGFQDTNAIDRAVASFTGHTIGEDGGARTPVDTRLRLATCAMVSLAWHGTAHDAVVVTCTGPEWRLFVPVRITASAPVPEGAAPAAAVNAAPVIKRGDPVMISAGSPGFSISREGIAMGDAAPGGRFLVKCDGSRTPVQAVAVEQGVATLPGWGE
ncbi:MAG: flagella basal body P-ring formation protein FlgA [Pseudomonadota bacterium]|nr:flagella basal body P-ring formation protein FlgA [Pseudomonadota bacterium]